MDGGTTTDERLTTPLSASDRDDVRTLVDQARREFNRRRHGLNYEREVRDALRAYARMTPAQILNLNAEVAA